MTSRDFLSIDDLSSDGLLALIDDADEAKAKPEAWANRLSGKQVAMIFEKPSTRTRVSFEVAINSMGGHALALRSDELQLGRGETFEDTGRVLSRYVDCLVVRTFSQDRLDWLAMATDVPVINALSDHEHPCQCVADLQTVREKVGKLSGARLAYLGDGNNVAHSLMLGGAKTGMDVVVAAPPGFEPAREVTARATAIATETGGRVTLTNAVDEAATGADVVYTDVWASMGQEGELEQRKAAFTPYQVNAAVLRLASDHVIAMHCLPAHRGEEITDEVIDGPRSVVWDQAENRLHAQKALLAWFLA